MLTYLIFPLQRSAGIEVCATESGKLFECPNSDCAVSFTTKQGFQRHMKKHQGIYAYYCPYCRKGINNTAMLKIHLRVHHTGLNGYHCNRCEQEFKSVHLLTAHLADNDC